MDIKEIAKRIRKTNNSYMLSMSPDIAAKFTEALIAEVAKQNEPVAYRWKEKGRWLSWYVDWTWHDKAKSLGFPVEYAYTYPPTAEQIANETAEAIAKMLELGPVYPEYIRSGALKEFKK